MAEYPTYRSTLSPAYFNDSRRLAHRGLEVGQRVIAQFAYGEPALAVISQVLADDRYAVQFEPCGAHYHVGTNVSPFGDAAGWTNREYRVARELSRSRERALAVERERRKAFPVGNASSVSGLTTLLDNAYQPIG